MTCFICGADCNTFDVICSKGIVKSCRDCIKKESLPLVRKPVEPNFNDIRKKQPVYDRLSRLSGVKLGDIRQKEPISNQDEELRKLVENRSVTMIQEDNAKEKLVENFHWVIMRVRRLRKLTRQQLAKEIGESESVIKILEQGGIPRGYIQLVSKIETLLDVRLFKEEPPEKSNGVGFDPVSTRELTIADLKEMKEERGIRIFEGPERVEFNEIQEEYILDENTNGDKPEFRRKRDITQDEMDRIIFGK